MAKNSKNYIGEYEYDDFARRQEAREISSFYFKFAIKYVFFPLFFGGIALGGYIAIFKIVLGW